MSVDHVITIIIVTLYSAIRKSFRGAGGVGSGGIKAPQLLKRRLLSVKAMSRLQTFSLVLLPVIWKSLAVDILLCNSEPVTQQNVYSQTRR